MAQTSGDERSFVVASTVMLALVTLVIGVLFYASVARGHDHGQFEELTPEIRDWFLNLKQPDNPGMSCCGLADAYYADIIEVDEKERGGVWAIVTDERPDGPLQRRHVPIGTRVFVPIAKLKWDRGNPTGHNVVFLTAPNEEGNHQVYCFVQSTGI